MMIIGMKMIDLKHSAKRAFLRVLHAIRRVTDFSLIAVCTLSFGVATSALAQGFGSQGITAADLSALKGAAALQNAAGSTGVLGAGAGLPGLLAITVPMGNGQEDVDQVQQDDKKAKKPAPLLPNEFQKYVLQTTGQNLPLYGADFVENLNNNNGQFSRSPVADD